MDAFYSRFNLLSLSSANHWVRIGKRVGKNAITCHMSTTCPKSRPRHIVLPSPDFSVVIPPLLVPSVQLHWLAQPLNNTNSGRACGTHREMPQHVCSALASPPSWSWGAAPLMPWLFTFPCPRYGSSQTRILTITYSDLFPLDSSCPYSKVYP